MLKIKRSQITDDDYNPRTISDANAKRLRASIRKNGLIGGLIWNKQTGHIVGGHQRLQALDSIIRKDDYDIDVVVLDVPLKEEVRLNVVLNNQDNQGVFDFPKIQNLIDNFKLDASEDFGFSQEVIDINFPDVAEVLAPEDTENGITEPVNFDASPEDIALMKEKKKESRERTNEFKQEYGDYHSEPKGILTIVFDRESAKKQWFLNHDVEDPPAVMHIYEFEKMLKIESSELPDNVDSDSQELPELDKD